MNKRLFGTDGIRGRFGTEPLDQTTVEAIGRAVIGWLATRPAASSAALSVIIAGDTRESTPELAKWIMAGLRHTAPSAAIRWGGVLPTPAVALLTRTTDADVGLVLSASHNPYHDNGIKIFDGSGQKLDDASELALEAHLAAELNQGVRATDTSVVALPSIDSALNDQYVRYLVDAFADAVTGLHVVLDTGNGAASALAAPVFEACGARTQLISAAPDGRNINAVCGSTAPERAAEVVRESGADLGFAFDGDADRVIVIDEQGQVRDGDEVLYLWAKMLHRRGELTPAAIVATSMSNLGLEHALGALGITVERCDVGDRAVAQMLRTKSLRLGGEQSGHIIDHSRSTTGDGLLTALAIAQTVRIEEQPLSELLQDFRRFPQRLKNVRVAAKTPFTEVPAIREHVARVEAELGDAGRLVLRYSGTEPLARVMIEAEDPQTVDRLVEALASTISEHLGESA